MLMLRASEVLLRGDVVTLRCVEMGRRTANSRGIRWRVASSASSERRSANSIVMKRSFFLGGGRC